MATNTLSQNINQAIDDFDSIKQAIIDKGVSVPAGTPTSEYSDKIVEIQVGDFQPPQKGFVVTEYNEDGYTKNGILYGINALPKYFFYNNYNSSANPSYGQFVYLENITLMENLISVGSNSFRGCTNLALTSLPAGITTIGTYAFYGCTNLALTSLPNGVTTIGDSAFGDCTNLTHLSIGNQITSINTYAFLRCKNITSITIHKAEGSISGAPWGATNATITWTGE